MPVNRAVGLSLGAAILLCSSGLDLAYAKPFMIVGTDEKVWWDDDGKAVPVRARQRFSFDRRCSQSRKSEDLGNAAPEEFGRWTAGQPRIDPTGAVALVADLVDVVKDGDALKQVPDNKVYVIDLKASPPKLAGDHHRRQAAVGAEHQPIRQDGAGRQSRR